MKAITKILLLTLFVVTQAANANCQKKLQLPDWIIEQYGENPDPKLIEKLRHPWPNSVNIQTFPDKNYSMVTFSLLNMNDPGIQTYRFLCNLNFNDLPEEGDLVHPETRESTRYKKTEITEHDPIQAYFGEYPSLAKTMLKKLSSPSNKGLFIVDHKFFNDSYNKPTKYEIEVIEWFHQIISFDTYKVALIPEPKPMKTVLSKGKKVSKQISKVRIPGVNYDEPAKEVVIKKPALRLSD